MIFALKHGNAVIEFLGPVDMLAPDFHDLCNRLKHAAVRQALATIGPERELFTTDLQEAYAALLEERGFKRTTQTAFELPESILLSPVPRHPGGARAANWLGHELSELVRLHNRTALTR